MFLEDKEEVQITKAGTTEGGGTREEAESYWTKSSLGYEVPVAQGLCEVWGYLATDALGIEG